jgi:hypothetical protein
MPIPSVKKGELEQDYISRCISELYNEYGQEQSAGICYTQWEKRDDMSSEEFKTLPTSDCIEKHISAGYTEAYAKLACSAPKENDGQQGGVAQFGRTKFEYSPNWKETMPEFMARCMSASEVREKKKDRGTRAGFCYGQYEKKYIANLAKRWK